MPQYHFVVSMIGKQVDKCEEKCLDLEENLDDLL